MAEATSDSDRLRALGKRLQGEVRGRYETEKRMPYGYKLRQYETPNRPIKSYKRGGRVHRTGIYKLHRGERVIAARPRRQSRR